MYDLRIQATQNLNFFRGGLFWGVRSRVTNSKKTQLSHSSNIALTGQRHLSRHSDFQPIEEQETRAVEPEPGAPAHFARACSPEPPEGSGTKRSVARSSEGVSGGGRRQCVTRADLTAFGSRPDAASVAGGGERASTRRERWGFWLGFNSPGAPFPIQSRSI
jgi:hypothetical protein